MYETKLGVATMKWQDNKSITVFSTAHNPRDVRFVKRKNRVIIDGFMSCCSGTVQ